MNRFAWSASVKLFAVANSLGSIREWLCMPTTILWRLAAAATLGVVLMFDDEVITGAPSAFAISKPRSISTSEKLSVKLMLYADSAIDALANWSRTRWK